MLNDILGRIWAFAWVFLELELSTQVRGSDRSQEEAVTWVLMALVSGLVLALTPLLELFEPSEDDCEGHS